MAEKKLVGVDVFIEYDQEDRNPQVLGKRIEAISAASELKLSLITNRGVKVYPHGLQETTCTDHWRCRFKAIDDQPLHHSQILSLLAAFDAAKLDFIKTEHLYTFNGEPGFSMGQGE